MKEVKLFILLFSLLIFTKQLDGQTGSITGTVVESSSGEPLPYANVALIKANDSTNVLKGTTSAMDGTFFFESISEGEYYIRLSFIGFETTYSQLFNHNINTNLGNIQIKPSEILLDNVTVKGEKDVFIQSIDRKIYNVEKDIMSESGSVSDILQNIPSVSVDIDGGVSIRGTSNIIFMINGRLSALLNRNAATALQQIPAKSIERIEVITNPSAQYKPDGTGGIINIIMKKEQDDGFNAQITANIGNEERYNMNLSLNYNLEDINIFANYGFRHNGRTVIFNDNRTNRDSLGYNIQNYYGEKGKSTNDAFSHIAGLGLNYEMNDYNSFEISGTYYNGNSMHRSFSDISILSPQNIAEIIFTSEDTNDEFEHEGEAGIAFEHTFKNKKDHNLGFEAAYAGFDEEEDQVYFEKQSFPIVENSKETNLVQKSGSQIEINTEYTNPLTEESEVVIGTQNEFYREDIRYTLNNDYSRFLYSQDIYAFYFLYEQEIEDFSFKTGLRAEHTRIESQLTAPFDSLIPQNDIKFYPSLHLMYELNDKASIILSYSKRVNRPDADELNPNPEFSDPRNAEAGNPDLKPEQIHSFEIGYHFRGKKFSFIPSLYYRYKYDAFTSIKNPIGDSLILRTIDNLKNQQSAGLELLLSGKITHKWDNTLSADLFYNQIDASNIGYSDSKSVFTGFVKLQSLYQLTSTFMLQLNTYYYASRITPQGHRDPFFYMNCGLKKQYFDKRLAFTFTVTDVLQTYKRKTLVDIPELYQTIEYYRKNAIIYFGFTWYFKKTDSGKKNSLDFEGESL